MPPFPSSQVLDCGDADHRSVTLSRTTLVASAALGRLLRLLGLLLRLVGISILGLARDWHHWVTYVLSAHRLRTS